MKLQLPTPAIELTDKIKIIRANAGGWSDNNISEKFDLVFAAPPYDDLKLVLLQKLAKHVKGSGIFVLDWPGKLETPKFADLQMVEQKSYGDAQLVFYRRK